MKRRTVMALAVVVGLIAWFIVQHELADQRADQLATYKGKHARVWAAELSGNFDPRGTNEAMTAFRVLGSNALPTLRSLLKKPPPFYERFFVQNTRYIPSAVRRFLFNQIKPGNTAALRISAVQAFSLVGPSAESAVPDLVTALADREVRWVAAQSLARLSGKAIPALAVATTNENVDVRHSAVYALGEAGTNAAPVAAVLFERVLDARESQAVRGSALYSLSRVGPTAMPIVLEGFSSIDPARRAAAVNAIKTMNTPPQKILPSLLDFSTNSSPALRQHAIEALQTLRLNYPRVIATYVRALNDPYPGVRCAAAQAMNQANVWATNAMLSEITARTLGLSGKLDSNIIASLTALLNDPEPLVRTTAQQALTDLRTATAN